MAKVLIVDECDVDRARIAGLLAAAGLAVRSARSIDTGLRIARAEHPDLVLMDLFLPSMVGIQTTRVLARDPATAAIPVVIMAAPAYASHKVRALWFGARDLLIKPLGARALHSVILPLASPISIPGRAAVGQ